MRSTAAPHTHTANTRREIQTEVGAGHFKYPVIVPKGTLCRCIQGTPGYEGALWVVSDLSKVECGAIARHDATYYGIRIEEADLENIKPK
jgi:hypothetical protein